MSDRTRLPSRHRLLAIVGPGLLVAATGVGAGDLASAAISGRELGVAILWAVVLGAFLKFVLTEGLARYQLASGATLLEGVLDRFGRPAAVLFGAYLFPWSFFVGAAMISACGVTGAALLREAGVADAGVPARIALGVVHSGLGVLLVWTGGYRLVERVMAACVGVMFVTVVTTALLLRPDLGAVARGLVVPTIPDFAGAGLTWTIGLMGGIGGTLTVLCYGYWIREEGREGPGALRTCRIDLATGYLVTALFGAAMVVIASGVTGATDGRGVSLVLSIADRLGAAIGPAGRIGFLVGAYAAVCSSLLGVWQAVPYVFADFWSMAVRGRAGPVDTRGLPYRAYLLALAIVPLAQVARPFREVQKYYVVFGAAFIPVLALVLLFLNGRRAPDAALRNRLATTVVLVLALALGLAAGWLQVRQRWS